MSIPGDTADAFLTRVGRARPDDVDAAFGAFGDDGTLIGVAVLGVTPAGTAPALVVVLPERRHHHVGGDLLRRVIDEATKRGALRMRVTYPAGAVGAEDLIRSCGLLSARRTVGGVVTVILLFPDGVFGPDQGDLRP